MAYGSGVRDCKTIPNGQIPLWLAVHEAGHLMARIQLVAAWNLAGLDNPSSFESIRVWIDERGKPRGLCQWGYKQPLSFRYQAIISAARPMAEARIRHAKRYDCLTAGEDYDIIMRSVSRGLADIDEALNEAMFIVRSCWPEIMKLATHLQTRHELTLQRYRCYWSCRTVRPFTARTIDPIHDIAENPVCNDFGNHIPYSAYLVPSCVS